jgi:hypothetical protein
VIDAFMMSDQTRPDGGIPFSFLGPGLFEPPQLKNQNFSDCCSWLSTVLQSLFPPLSPPSDVNGNRDLFHAVLILIESHNSNPNTARLNWCGEEKWKWTNDLDFPQKYSTACSNKTENEQTAQNSNGSSQILSALPMRLMVLAKLKLGQVGQRHYSAPKVINSDPS